MRHVANPFEGPSVKQSHRSRAGGAARDQVIDTGRREAGPAGELRDTELAISLWRRKATEFGGLPPATAFDFSWMIGGSWSHRFVICADAADGELTFLMYGSRFAQLLELPPEPVTGLPIARQLPRRYLPLFNEGCHDAIARADPVRLSGAVVDYGQIELYRAAFMPLALRQNSPMQLIFGSFNYRIGPSANSADAVRKTYNAIFEDAQSAKAPASSSQRPASGPRGAGPDG
jgi:hypothetical protein